MAIYQYKARNQDGKEIIGTVEATSSHAVAEIVLKRKLMPIQIRIASSSSTFFAKLKNSSLFVKPVSKDEMIIFCKQLATLLKAGVPILTALEKINTMTRSALLRSTLENIIHNVSTGLTLATAMEPHPRVFSKVFINLVSTGENTGQLDKAFLELAKYMQLESTTKKRIKEATRYPKIVSISLVLAVIILNLFVIPKFEPIFASSKTQLPLPTRILMTSSHLTQHYWGLLLLIFIAIYAGFHYITKKTEIGHLAWDHCKLKMPIFGIILLRITLARFARTLAMVTKAGLSINQGLKLVSESSDNAYVSKHIDMMCDQVERGTPLHQAAKATHLFTPLILQMLEIGEESGMINEMMGEAATVYEQEVEYDLSRLSSLIEPILLGVLGGIMLIVMLAIFLPIFGLVNAYR